MSENNRFCSLALGSSYTCVICEVRRLTKQDPGITREKLKAKRVNKTQYLGLPLGTLRSDDGDVHENVTDKWTPHSFKPFRDFPKSPCYLKEGNLGWN